MTTNIWPLWSWHCAFLQASAFFERHLEKAFCQESSHAPVWTYTHITTNKHTDSFWTIPVKGFQQVAVIRGRDRARVSEDSQRALRQQGVIWKTRPYIQLPLWYCLPAGWRHRGVFNEHCIPAACLKVGLSIHSFSMTLCITGKTADREVGARVEGASHSRLSFFLRSIHNKACKVEDGKHCKVIT